MIDWIVNKAGRWMERWTEQDSAEKKIIFWNDMNRIENGISEENLTDCHERKISRNILNVDE